MASSLKISFLYYKNLLDLAFTEFFEEFGHCFTRQVDGTYLFSSDVSRSKLKKFFKESILRRIASLSRPWSIDDPRCLVVIGSCFPCDNSVLELKTKKDIFPAALDSALTNTPSLKWVLREQDIKLDDLEFNEVLVEIFNELFKKSTKHQSFFKNIMVVTHKNLDCYAIFKILKWTYGKSATVNLYEATGMSKKKLPLVAINDLLSKHIHNKEALSRNMKFKQSAKELREYASSWMSELLSA